MDEHRTTDDSEHLNLLVIFHWIVAAITGLFALFPLLHLVIGIGLVNGSFPGPSRSEHEPIPAQAVGWFFIAFAVVWIVASLTMAFCLALSARSLSRQKRRTFCMVVAAISCVFFPFGTALGVFTLIVLSRPSVRALFVGSAAPVTPDY